MYCLILQEETPINAQYSNIENPATQYSNTTDNPAAQYSNTAENSAAQYSNTAENPVETQYSNTGDNPAETQYSNTGDNPQYSNTGDNPAEIQYSNTTEELVDEQEKQSSKDDAKVLNMRICIDMGSPEDTSNSSLNFSNDSLLPPKKTFSLGGHLISSQSASPNESSLGEAEPFGGEAHPTVNRTQPIIFLYHRTKFMS